MSSDHVALIQADSELGEKEALHHKSASKKIACACIAAATLALMFYSASRTQSLVAANPGGVVSKAVGDEVPVHFPDHVKGLFIENCINAFKGGNEGMHTWAQHRFKEDKLDALCKKYWNGYLKRWTRWNPSKDMYPSAMKVEDWGNMCEGRDDTTKEWWNDNEMGKFLFPDVDGNGNQWISNCGTFFDLVAQTNKVKADEEIIPEEKRKKCHGGAQVVKVKDGYYCHSTRVGLGNEHGFGHASLEDCGSSAESDERCHADGYFDGRKTGDGKFQCKCPTGTCVMSSNPQARGWAIYQSEEGAVDCS